MRERLTLHAEGMTGAKEISDVREQGNGQVLLLTELQRWSELSLAWKLARGHIHSTRDRAQGHAGRLWMWGGH